MEKNTGQPKKINLYTGTVNSPSPAAITAARKFLDDCEALGSPLAVRQYENSTQKSVREKLAVIYNIKPEHFALIHNLTDGIIKAAESLPLKPDDEILLLSNEYPANIFPWKKLEKQNGITVRIITDENNEKATEKLIEAISDKTKVIAISEIQYLDGYHTDIPRLSKICQDKGIFLVIDAAQSAGIRSLDLTKHPVSFLIAGGQKYLGGVLGMGIGFMFVNPDIMPFLKDTHVGFRSVKNPAVIDSYELKDNAERFEEGTINLLGLVSINADLEEIMNTGMEKIEAESQACYEKLTSILRAKNIDFISHERHGNIVTIPMQGKDGRELTSALAEKNIFVRSLKDGAYIRLSFLPRNVSDEDFEITAEAIREWFSQD